MNSSLFTLFAGIDTAIARVLDRALAGKDLTLNDAMILDGARGRELHALVLVADELRQRQVGERVSYVINRNINFTNVCVKGCKFCAFSRDLRHDQAYFLSSDEVIRRAREAWELGATEVCLQAGLAPDADGRIYIDLCHALHQALPNLHLHAFSPEEVKYGAVRARMSITDYLRQLKEAGLGSLPGTSAEILDDNLRRSISPGRITVAEWIQVITEAHRLGLRTTATMMFGHVETPAQRYAHMLLLRDIQRDTGGFTEFVPLSFVHSEAPLFVAGNVPGVRPGPTGDEVVRLYAIARLLLGADIPNLQASWVKEGPRMAAWLLNCGVNDLGGTLINESISTAAGAPYGQRITPAELRRLIRAAGRLPVQRTTTYDVVREFAAEPSPGEAEAEPLNFMADADAHFGSYAALTADERWRYRFKPTSAVR